MSDGDAFATLGLPPRFDLDEADLHRRFIAASAGAHPDRHADPIAQAEAAERSAAINEAYRVLRDPESRAAALLAALGGPAKEEDKSLPPDLLVEMMAVRERQEEAVETGDAATLRELADWARAQREAHLARVAELFDQAQSAGPRERADALRAVRLELNALRYFQRMIEQSPGGDG